MLMTRRPAGLATGLLLAALAWVAGCRAVLEPRLAPAEPVELTLLSINDLHGALEPVARDVQGRPLGGAAALAGLIAQERRANPQGTLLLDGGDFLEGSALSSLTEGRAVVDFLNHVGLDAAVVGNHEFDRGIDRLRARIRQASFPVLLANVVEKATGRAPPWATPYEVVERRGLRIAVIGLITRETPLVTLPDNVETLDFPDPAEVANRLIAELVPARADVVVLLCHIGGWQDAATGAIAGEIADLAAAVRGADAIVAGHTHELIAGEIGGVPVVEALDDGSHLGRIRLHVDPATREVVGSEVRVLPVYAGVAPLDRRAAALVARHRREMAAALDEVVGEAAVELTAQYRECGMGNLVVDVVRERTGADLAFQNPGGVRASLAAGPIRYRDVFDVIPFDNTIVLVELTGAEVLTLLEQATDFAVFLHVSGLRYRIDGSRPPGSRVTVVPPLDAARTYRVAVNSFMAQGGDRLPLLAGRPEARDTGVLLRDALVDWIRKEDRAGRKIRAGVEGRVELSRG
jgi:2',3'-cyclic-nucleotide 2'-phosphodiesterase/3'-nucleotidase